MTLPNIRWRCSWAGRIRRTWREPRGSGGRWAPAALGEAARIGTSLRYDEITLNVACPSDGVQSGRFGACLMREPALVAECVAATRPDPSLPVAVTCRTEVGD